MERVWVKGDKCIAKFSGDGNWYEAKIKKLYKSATCQKVAWVGFEGYSSEEDEEVKLSCLKTFEIASKKKKDSPKTPEHAGTSGLSSKAMFSPLQGNEEKLRLEEKYKLLEEEEERYQRRKWETTKKTSVDFPKRKDKFSPKSTPKQKALMIKGRTEKTERIPREHKSVDEITKKIDKPVADPKRYVSEINCRCAIYHLQK